jgi:hypothetical protein
MILKDDRLTSKEEHSNVGDILIMKSGKWHLIVNSFEGDKYPFALLELESNAIVDGYMKLEDLVVNHNMSDDDRIVDIIRKEKVSLHIN